MGQEQSAFLETISLSHLVEEVVAPQRSLGLDVEVAVEGEEPEPTTRRNPGVVYGLSNILDNAVGFAEEKVVLRAHWTQDEVRMEIRDDGPGYAPEVLLRVGEPYVTTRSAAKRAEEGDVRARARALHRQDPDRALRRPARALERGAAGDRRGGADRLAAGRLRARRRPGAAGRRRRADDEQTSRSHIRIKPDAWTGARRPGAECKEITRWRRRPRRSRLAPTRAS